MAKKKPKPDFVIRMVGPGVRPWIVPMRTLTRALQAVQRLLDQREDHDEEESASDGTEPCEDSILHLIGLSARSAGYAVASDLGESSLRTLRLVGEAISDPVGADWTPAVLSSVRDLSDVAKSLGCEIELRLPGAGTTYGDVLAKIAPESFANIAEHAFARGRTSVYARLERVGGATEMHCGIRIPKQSRRMVICRLANADLARDLGKHLYEHVVLSGDAEWVRHSWHIRSMYVTAFEPPKTGSVMDALDSIHRAGGEGWDSVVDPEIELQEIRGE